MSNDATAGYTNDMLPLDSFSLAGELSRASDSIKWARANERQDFEETAKLVTAVGCFAGNCSRSCSTRARRNGILFIIV